MQFSWSPLFLPNFISIHTWNDLEQQQHAFKAFVIVVCWFVRGRNNEERKTVLFFALLVRRNKKDFNVRNFRLQLKIAFDVSLSLAFLSLKHYSFLLFQHICIALTLTDTNWMCVFVFRFVFGTDLFFIYFFLVVVDFFFFFFWFLLILLSFFSSRSCVRLILPLFVKSLLNRSNNSNKLRGIFWTAIHVNYNSLFTEIFPDSVFRSVSFFFSLFFLYFDNVIYCAYIECAKN